MVDNAPGAKEVVKSANVGPIWLHPSLAEMEGKMI